mmetsp:Transcript_33850/g.51022  ORF Transcript_33850/g.51022 Transcript_33850/m.51022 type:complete len:479 (-) Transcript_33850:2124-3560(-)
MSTYFWEIENKELVVLPSLSFDTHELQSVPGILHYEERLLYVLLALKTEKTRIIYITSCPLDTGIIEYYISLLPPHVQKTASSKIRFLSVCDTNTSTSLAEKVFTRPRFLTRLKSLIQNPTICSLMILRGTHYENEIAKALDIPMYSAKPKDQVHGSKAGSRALFQLLNIPCADGTFSGCSQIEDLIQEILSVIKRNPLAEKGVVKLLDGFSGKGNAIVDLSNIQNAIALNESSAVLSEIMLHSLKEMEFCCQGRSWADFSAEISKMGAIFELYVANGTSSPSVQVVVNEDFTISVLSTHEQILDGQIYEGCAFPADKSYRTELIKYGRQVGEFFAANGIIDHFSVEFVCVKEKLYAIEINLRITGTTHPFMALKLLTDGKTDQDTGIYYTNAKTEKYYVASDNISHPTLKNMLPMDIKDIFAAQKFHWCSIRQTGVVCHLLGCMAEHGKIGITSIANSPHEAQEQFDQVVAYLTSLS